jgi:hypothetical protein
VRIVSFRECIANAAADGDITATQAQEVRDLFDAVRGELARDLGVEAAESQAARITYDRLKADVAHRRRVKILNMQAFRARQADMAGYSQAGRPGKALSALISRDARSRATSLELYQRAVEKDLYARMDSLLYEFRLTVTGGARNEALMRDIVTEAFGRDSGNVTARELARSWTETAEVARQRANSGGMRIAKLENWGLPQAHDAVRIRAAGKDAWIAYTLDRLDKSAMRNKHGLAWTDETLAAELSNTYDTIVTNGFNKLRPGTSQRGRALHNRSTDHRFLVFKDPAAWLEYQARYGSDNTFEVMVGHIRSVARDIAQMEMFGPSPSSTVAALKDYARKVVLESADEKAIARVEGDLVKFDQLWDLATRGEQTASQLWATIGSGTRSWISASLLGGAPLSAISDFGTQRIAASMIGMPVTPLMQRVFSEMLQGADSAKFAARMGLVADAWLNVGSANARYFGDAMLPGLSRRIGDTAHRLSGLTGLTRAGRQAFGLELQGYLGDNVGRSFSELHEGLQQILQRNGISPAEWDTIRATPLFEHQGATFLRVLDIADRTDIPKRTARELAAKAFAMVESEMDQAVPTSTLRARLAFTGNSARGTASGELLRFAGMFKTFPVTLLVNNLARMLDQPTNTARARWVSDFVISATVFGALAYQAKQMVYGRDPRPMDTSEFWIAAVLQGGGLGILGDFLFTNVNRFGKGFGSTIAGPGAGLGTDAINLSVGNLVQLASGEDTDFARELTDFVARYTPGASIWYLRLLAERLVIDQVRLMTDPKAEQRFRRKVRTYERDYGQQFWWLPGETTPERAPDISAAFGD